MHHKRVNISHVLAGQKLGIKEIDDGIWLVTSSMSRSAAKQCAISPN
jgi:hypothetical protein